MNRDIAAFKAGQKLHGKQLLAISFSEQQSCMQEMRKVWAVPKALCWFTLCRKHVHHLISHHKFREFAICIRLYSTTQDLAHGILFPMFSAVVEKANAPGRRNQLAEALKAAFFNDVTYGLFDVKSKPDQGIADPAVELSLLEKPAIFILSTPTACQN